MLGFTNATSPISPSEQASQAEVLPWLIHASPEWILGKDGSLLCGLDYQAIDVDNVDGFLIEQVFRELPMAISTLDERYSMWWVVDKKQLLNYDKPDHGHDIANAIDEATARQYENGRMWRITFRLFVLYTGETGVFAYMDAVRNMVTRDGISTPMAMLKALNPNVVGNAAVLSDLRQLEGNLEQAESGLQKFLATNSLLKFSRLTDSELDNALIQCANPSIGLDSGYAPQAGIMLDSCAALTDVSYGAEVIRFDGPHRSIYAANLSLTNYPSPQMGLVDALLTMPIEFRITHVVMCMGSMKAAMVLNECERYFKLNRANTFQKVIAAVTKKPVVVDPAGQQLYEEAVEASTLQKSEGVGWCNHAMTITVMASTTKSLERHVSDTLKKLNTVPLMRERIGLKASHRATIPGQWAQQKRLLLVNHGILMHMLPLITISEGQPRSEYFSALYERPMPSLSTFKTAYGTPCHLNPHTGQVGHALLVMPTGGGKTTFVNFCMSQFKRYPNAQVFVFDRDYSCKVITKLMDGSHVDLKSGNIGLNPMACMHQDGFGKLRAREFLVNRLSEAGMQITPDDRNAIDDKINVIVSTGQPVRMSVISDLLPKHLKDGLQEWRKGQPYGMFDAEEDGLSFSSWTTIEMREILSNERLARAFMEHAFQVIMSRLGKVPTFIYLEEASFLFNNATFLAALDGWLKTFRKLDAFVWMTVQSPESVTSVGNDAVKATLVDNVPNLILGANGKLEIHRHVYKDVLGMADTQIDLLKQLKPRRDYLHVSNGFCRVMASEFDQDTLAHIRSEPKFQELSEREIALGGDWKSRYIQQAKLL